MIDITITATIRPKIYEICLLSIIENIINENKDYNFKLIVNIDFIGETKQYNQETIEEITKKHYDDCVFIKSDKPNFPLAVKNLWDSTTSPYVLHTEDDRQFINKLNVDEIISILEKDNAGCVWIQGKLDRLKSFGFSITDVDSYYLINKEKKVPNCLMTLNPCFYKKEFLHALTPFIKKGASPEKVLRLQDTSQLVGNELQDLIETINKGDYYVYKKHNLKNVYSVDIGREWRKKMGFFKNKKNNIESVISTWEKPRKIKVWD